MQLKFIAMTYLYDRKGKKKKEQKETLKLDNGSIYDNRRQRTYNYHKTTATRYMNHIARQFSGTTRF